MEAEQRGPAPLGTSLSSEKISPKTRRRGRSFGHRGFGQRRSFEHGLIVLSSAPGLGMQHLQTRRGRFQVNGHGGYPLQQRFQRRKSLPGGFQHIHQSGSIAGLLRRLIFQSPVLLIPAAHALLELKQPEGERFTDHTERLELVAHAVRPGILRRQGRHGFTQQTNAWPDGIGAGRWRQISAL